MAGTLPEYPAPPGNKNQVVATVAGPASYSQISIASPPTGGQTIKAVDYGLVDFDFVEPSASDTGSDGVRVIYPNNPQAPVTSVILQWFIIATGAERAGAANLSAKTVRLRMVGH